MIFGPTDIGATLAFGAEVGLVAGVSGAAGAADFLEVLTATALEGAASLVVVKFLSGAACFLSFSETENDFADAEDLEGDAFFVGTVFEVTADFLTDSAFLPGAVLALLAVTGVATSFLFEVFTSCLLAV